ncbi:MAG TPA: GNAT family N-acetyltransferase [Dehalococcoidia bacterium]|nr:GNAT family N-acetyltransferase [Dehalococcoidia bacterium]
MVRINLNYKPLDEALFARYASNYLPPDLLDEQFELKTDSGWIVTNDSKTIGFIWGRDALRDDKKTRYVLRLEVNKAYRNLGIGSELLKKYEADSTDSDRKQLVFSVIENEESHDAALKVAKRNGWGKPEIGAYCYRTTIEKFFESVPWAEKHREYRYQQYLFPWKELTSAERNQLKDEEGPDSWRDEPDPASPLVFGRDFEPNTSLGVRIDGEIVGWMINGLYGADTVLYGSYFVRRPYRNAGMAISLLLEALKRQREAEIPNCIWFAQKSNPEAKRLYDKILAPCILSRNRVYSVKKVLHDS